MLGVRFLDVDFMRINSARASPTVYVIHLLEQPTTPAVALAPNRDAKLSAPHPPRSFELGRNARRRLVEAAHQGRLLQGIAASVALYWGKNGPAVANCASLPSNLFRAIQGRTLMLPLKAFIALVVTWCLLAVAAIVAASI